MANRSLGIDFKDVIDHGIHGIPHCFNAIDRRLEKREGPLTADAGQDNQTRVKLFGSDKRAEITRILGNDNKFASGASLQHTMIGVSATPKIQRVLGYMLTACIQFAGQLWGQALINKQTHVAS